MKVFVVNWKKLNTIGGVLRQERSTTHEVKHTKMKKKKKEEENNPSVLR
jgi:hypothetical protein